MAIVNDFNKTAFASIFELIERKDAANDFAFFLANAHRGEAEYNKSTAKYAAHCFIVTALYKNNKVVSAKSALDATEYLALNYRECFKKIDACFRALLLCEEQAINAGKTPDDYSKALVMVARHILKKHVPDFDPHKNDFWHEYFRKTPPAGIKVTYA